MYVSKVTALEVIHWKVPFLLLLKTEKLLFIFLYSFLSPSWTIKECRIKLRIVIGLISYLYKNEHYWNILKSTFNGGKNTNDFVVVYYPSVSLLGMSIGDRFRHMMVFSAWLLPVGSRNFQIKNVIIECNYFNFSSTVCFQLYSKLMQLTLVMNT